MSLRSLWMALLRRLRRVPGAAAPGQAGASSPGSDAPAPIAGASGAAAALERARQAFAAGQLEQADDFAARSLRALDDAPEDDDAAPLARERRAALVSALLAVRGGVAARAGRLSEATEIFERSRERAAASRNAAALGAAALNLLDVGTRQGRRDAADPLFEEAVRGTRGTPYEDILVKLVIERGVAAIAGGALPDAIRLFDRALALRPTWPFPWYQRGWARFLSGDAGGALEDYRECAARKRPFFTVLREIRCLEDVAAGVLPLEAYRAYCLVRDRVREQAAGVEDTAARLAERFPDFAPAHVLRAEARFAMGDADGAREAACEAMRHDPDPDTASAALFLQWSIARGKKDADAQRDAGNRLLEAYRDSATAEIVRRLQEQGPRDVVLRWTWAMDGTFHVEEGLPFRPDGGSAPGSA